MSHCSRQKKKRSMPFSQMTMTGWFMTNMQQECFQKFSIVRGARVRNFVFHLELVWALSCLESYSQPYFAMGDNFLRLLETAEPN